MRVCLSFRQAMRAHHERGEEKFSELYATGCRDEGERGRLHEYIYTTEILRIGRAGLATERI